MKIALIVIGKTDAGYFVEAINEYKNRLVHYIPFEMEVIPCLLYTSPSPRDAY